MFYIYKEIYIVEFRNEIVCYLFLECGYLILLNVERSIVFFEGGDGCY